MEQALGSTGDAGKAAQPSPATHPVSPRSGIRHLSGTGSLDELEELTSDVHEAPRGLLRLPRGGLAGLHTVPADQEEEPLAAVGSVPYERPQKQSQPQQQQQGPSPARRQSRKDSHPELDIVSPSRLSSSVPSSASPLASGGVGQQSVSRAQQLSPTFRGGRRGMSSAPRARAGSPRPQHTPPHHHRAFQSSLPTPADDDDVDPAVAASEAGAGGGNRKSPSRRRGRGRRRAAQLFPSGGGGGGRLTEQSLENLSPRSTAATATSSRRGGYGSQEDEDEDDDNQDEDEEDDQELMASGAPLERSVSDISSQQLPLRQPEYSERHDFASPIRGPASPPQATKPLLSSVDRVSLATLPQAPSMLPWSVPESERAGPEEEEEFPEREVRQEFEPSERGQEQEQEYPRERHPPSDRRQLESFSNTNIRPQQPSPAAGRHGRSRSEFSIGSESQEDRGHPSSEYAGILQQPGCLTEEVAEAESSGGSIGTRRGSSIESSSSRPLGPLSFHSFASTVAAAAAASDRPESPSVSAPSGSVAATAGSRGSPRPAISLPRQSTQPPPTRSNNLPETLLSPSGRRPKQHRSSASMPGSSASEDVGQSPPRGGQHERGASAGPSSSVMQQQQGKGRRRQTLPSPASPQPEEDDDDVPSEPRLAEDLEDDELSFPLLPPSLPPPELVSPPPRPSHQPQQQVQPRQQQEHPRQQQRQQQPADKDKYPVTSPPELRPLLETIRARVVGLLLEEIPVPVSAATGAGTTGSPTTAAGQEHQRAPSTELQPQQQPAPEHEQTYIMMPTLRANFLADCADAETIRQQQQQYGPAVVQHLPPMLSSVDFHRRRELFQNLEAFWMSMVKVHHLPPTAALRSAAVAAVTNAGGAASRTYGGGGGGGPGGSAGSSRRSSRRTSFRSGFGRRGGGGGGGSQRPSVTSAANIAAAAAVAGNGGGGGGGRGSQLTGVQFPPLQQPYLQQHQQQQPPQEQQQQLQPHHRRSFGQ